MPASGSLFAMARTRVTSSLLVNTLGVWAPPTRCSAARTSLPRAPLPHGVWRAPTVWPGAARRQELRLAAEEAEQAELACQAAEELKAALAKARTTKAGLIFAVVLVTAGVGIGIYCRTGGHRVCSRGDRWSTLR